MAQRSVVRHSATQQLGGKPAVLEELLATAREAFLDSDPVERVAGLEIVMLGGQEMAMIDPAILQEVADLLTDEDPDVRRTAFLALDQLEAELSRPPSSNAEERQAVHRGASFEDDQNMELLNRAGSFNRKMPREEAMQALSTILLGRKGAGFAAAPGSLKAVADMRKAGVAKEVVPHLTDAVRASKEGPIRQAATDALMRLGMRQATHQKFGAGQLVEVLRTDGAWSPGTIKKVTASLVTVSLEDGSFKDLPPSMSEKCIRNMQPSLSLKPQVGECSDLELRAEAMDGLSAALKARSNKLLNELDDLQAQFEA